MTTPDTPLLHVSEQAWGAIAPKAAFVHVSLTASKLFSGRAALANARELRGLANQLEERGVPETALSLDGAWLDVETGLFTRSSSVTYRARIHVTDIERVADVIDAIAECKQATLTDIEWDYKNADGTEELLAGCAARARTKAARLAAALGVTVGAIHAIHEEELEEATPPPMRLAALEGMVMARRKSVAGELGGLELAPTKQVGVRVRVSYRVAGSIAAQSA